MDEIAQLALIMAQLCFIFLMLSGDFILSPFLYGFCWLFGKAFGLVSVHDAFR